MEERNLEAISAHVGTDDGDLTGVIQIDGHSNVSSIYALCKDHGFKTSDKFIVGFGMAEQLVPGVAKDAIDCAILYVYKKAYGTNFEEIAATIKRNIGTLKVEKSYITVKYADLGKYIKRFDFLAMSELMAYATTIEIEDNN